MSQGNNPQVVIIGAGLGGIATAIALQTRLKFRNFIILEKAASVGGTWRDNTYPGCACDIPVHWYSLSSEINPDWKKQFASQADILEYWKGLFEKYNFARVTRLNTEVLQLVWDENRQLWSLNVAQKTETGVVTSIIEANVVVSAMGSFYAPAYLNIQGRDRFKGIQFHSSQWDHTVSLSGKKVGVIGNGCSAVQFIPEISKDPSVRVINVCRTPSWFMPREQFQFPSLIRWAFRYIPGLARLYRNVLAALLDSRAFMWKKKYWPIRKIVEYVVLLYMRIKAPKKHHKDLTPDYAMGCKRVILDPGYYSCLHRPNVDLAWGGVKEVVEDGLITGKGQKFQLDVIIYGTGFQTTDSDMKIVGRNGLALLDFFRSKGGPEAYLSVAYPSFPNYFTLHGPNTATGHTSALFAIEMQITYIVQLIQPILEGHARSYDVKAQVSDEYNADLQRRMAGMTWTDCRSFYRTGDNLDGKNIYSFPGSGFRVWRLLKSVNFEDYVCVAGEDRKNV